MAESTNKYKIQTLNNISSKGLERLPLENYEVASEIIHPDAILLRSFKMHDMEIPPTLLAVGRAGAGVNNIPVEKLGNLGIPVFNAPGANANAVKELVVAGMLMAARNIGQAWQYAAQLTGDDQEIHKQVEAGKKQFAGFELPGHTLGVVGLGAIGVQVANAARSLGMRVIGYDPTITVRSAWQLSADVEQAANVDELLSKVDFITFHVPLIESTRKMINADRIQGMRDNAVILNFARDGIVDDAAVVEGLDAGKLYSYICDFPSNLLKKHPRVITLPHLGASTREAEENCAIMVAEEVRDFLEHGNIRNSVNFPEVNLPRQGAARIALANENRPDMLGQVSHGLGQAGCNISHMVNESRGELAYTLVDVDATVDQNVAEQLQQIDGVLKVRIL